MGSLRQISSISIRLFVADFNSQALLKEPPPHGKAAGLPHATEGIRLDLVRDLAHDGTEHQNASKET